MLRIRRFEEKCVELYQSEKIRGFMHLYDGEEAVSVGVIEALRPRDAIVATYREHGQALARGIGMDVLMAECTASWKAAAAAAAARCTSSIARPGSMAATRSSAAGCRSPSAPRWATRCSSATP